ncbi:hypothetical protein V6615_14750 [Oscillospiraceae bacterium PP1C4]
MIIVTARGADRRLSGLLSKSCAGKISVLCVDTASAAFSGTGPDIVFVTQQAFSHIACENAAFIVRSNNCLPQQIDCAHAVAIVDSSSSAVMEQVALRHLRALTCGLATSDTFTLSSLTADSAVVSLQRRIVAFDGTSVEPFELPVFFSERIEPFSLLACAAIFCLMGKRNPLLQAASWTIESF